MSHPPSTTTPAKVKEMNLNVSEFDSRKFRLVELENKLQVLMIEDASSPVSAVSLNVNGIGSLVDPKDWQGAAHFVEHLLFLGTEEFPGEADYHEWMAEHGGRTNAFTASDHTNYHFCVPTSSFENGLRRFSRFQVCPLFDAGGVSREVKAVDSEFAKNRENSAWRSFHLGRATSNPESQASNFTIGHSGTLWDEPTARGEDPREKAMKFYDDHYCAGLMRVVMISNLPLDKQQELAVYNFSDVVNKGYEVPTTASIPQYTKEQMGHVVKFAPVKDLRTLALKWTSSIPIIRGQYKNGGASTMGLLLGHEGEGSLLMKLQDLGWATGLSAGAYAPTADSTHAEITVYLSEDGLEHWEEVAEYAFQCIGMAVKCDGEALRAFMTEEAEIAKQSFLFPSPAAPINEAVSVARSMASFLPEDYIQNYVGQAIDPEAARVLLKALKPSTCMVFLRAPELAEEDLGSLEPIFGIKYGKAQVSTETMAKWEAAYTAGSPTGTFHLPPPNPFVASDFSLASGRIPGGEKADITMLPETEKGVALTLEDLKGHPCLSPRGVQVLRAHSHGGCWCYTDTTLDTPNVCATVMLENPSLRDHRSTEVYLSILSVLIKTRYSELLYAAGLAGIHYGMYASNGMAIFKFDGFSHRMPEFIAAISAAIGGGFVLDPSSPTDQVLFKMVVEKERRVWMNLDTREARSTVESVRLRMFETNRVERNDAISICENTTIEGFCAFMTLFRASSPTTLHSSFTGNINAETATKVDLQLREAFGAVSDLSHASDVLGCSPSRAVVVPKGTSVHFAFHPHDTANTSAVCTYFELGAYSPKTAAIAFLLQKAGKSRCFDQLRTKEKLGYVVFFSMRFGLGTISMACTVQGSDHSAAHIHSRIESWATGMVKELQELTPEAFANTRNSILEDLLQPKTTVDDFHMRSSVELTRRRGLPFQVSAAVGKELLALTQEDLVDCWSSLIAQGGKKRHSVVLAHEYRSFGAPKAEMKEGEETPATLVDERSEPEYPCDEKFSYQKIVHPRRWTASLPTYPAPFFGEWQGLCSDE